MNLYRWASHHARAVLLIVISLCVLGVVLARQLPVAIFPDLTIPRIIIAAEGGDAPASNILVTVTKPIEEAVSTVPGLRLVQSQTVRGSAGFMLTFAWGTDMATALQLVQARLAQIRGAIPAEIDVTAERLNPTVFPILDYSLTSSSQSLGELRILGLYTLRPRLARVPGVWRVLVNGGDTPEFVVTVRPDRLAARAVTLAQVENALTSANAVSTAGIYDSRYLTHLVLVSGLLHNLDAIRHVVVTVTNHVPIFVGDVADVAEGIARRTVIATGGMKPAVLLNIIRQPDANTVQVADDVRAELGNIRSTLPPDVHISPFYDQSQIVRESEASVIEAIAIGGFLALIVVASFLRNARSAFAALVLLPLTLSITFAAFRPLGMSLNIMTLGGIAIALGLVIDDAIVVVEYIFHRLEAGDSRKRAVDNAMKEITRPMLAATASTVVTFVPLVLLPGVTGNFFAPLAETMIVTLVISLVLSLTVVPLLAGWIFPHSAQAMRRRPAHARRLERTEAGKGEMSSAELAHRGLVVRIYGWIVRGALRRPWVLLASIVPISLAAYMLYSRLQTGFMPEFDEGAFVIDYKMPAGTSLVETDRIMRQVEAILRSTPGIATWSRLTGAQSGSGLEITPINQGDVDVLLTTGHRPSADEIMDDVRAKIQAAVPNLHVEFAAILGDMIGDMAGSPAPIEVKVFGQDPVALATVAHEVGRRVASINGVVDEADGITESGPETMVKVDPVRAAALGLATDTITSDVRGALEGDIAGFVQRGDLLQPIRVRYPYQRESTEQRVANLQIVTPAGQAVPLTSVADVSARPGTPELDRENQRLMDSVTARLAGIDLGTAVRAVRAQLATLALPAGFSIEYGGLYKSQQESFSALGAVLAAAGALVFCVLVFAFRSFRIAFSLFVAAVLSLFGVAVALWATSTPLNISSYTGAIMIVGIVTENGVLLFDELARLRRSSPNAPVAELLKQAGEARLRPILMTISAAILALFPLALGIGAGAAMQKPLAIAVMGGLALSTFFTLLLAPVLYATMAGRTRIRIEHGEETEMRVEH